MSDTEQPAIEIRGVNKRFGRKPVLDDLTLTVRPGQTFAFLGRNGAGKTTAIRMLLGLLKPDAGSIHVLGMDPRRESLEVRRRVGYLAEDQAMFGWMRVSELISFMAPFYPTWDAGWAKQLAERFELPARTRVRHLSKGQGVRLGLLLALAHRPKLVILDDPTLGLDPIMRKEFLRDVVTYLQGENVTVFFSSHLLYEIDAVADTVAILDRGRIVRQADTDALRDHVKRIVVPAEAEAKLADLPGLLDLAQAGRQAAAVVEDVDAALPLVAGAGVPYEVVDLNLDEIFEAYVIGRRGKEDNHGHGPAHLERVA
ncbi:MAG TPA: ABC transporter ATP-binding protein [Tepidisphaeraceae bacterium]|jgi:ABC-2 type transport system ATP-binding protein